MIPNKISESPIKGYLLLHGINNINLEKEEVHLNIDHILHIVKISEKETHVSTSGRLFIIPDNTCKFDDFVKLLNKIKAE